MSKPVFLVYIDAKLLHLTYVIIQYKKYIIRKWISSRKATDSIQKKKNPQKHKKNNVQATSFYCTSFYCASDIGLALFFLN